MPNVLVVGGAGYIGSHMVAILLKQGFLVSVFDNLSRGHKDACEGAHFIQGDLLDFSEISDCLAAQSFDIVFHFAALAYVGESAKHPEQYFQNNVVGSVNLLSAMRKHKLNRLVFSSTCSTYGEVERLPIRETDPQAPVNPYGFSKLVVERMLADYTKAYGFQSISLRYFNAAGCDPLGLIGERHEPETHLIPLTLREALRTKLGGNPKDTALQIFGDDFETPDGSCQRDYVHVNDLCEAHLLAAQQLLISHEGQAKYYNLANSVAYSVFEIISACRRLTRQPIEYRIASRRPGDPAILIGDAQKATKELGWQPRHVQLDDMISSAWNYLLRH